VDQGIFQVDLPAEDAPHLAPKDQIVTAVKAFEQCALIVGIYYKGKYGTPMLPIIVHEENPALNFHLDNE
jgi:hypothetical protein